jgi:tripartite-type tricarboxylate transporter receptor subunit TctC
MFHHALSSCRRLALPSLLTAIGLFGLPAFAQTWPTKTITVVVPFPAGGGTDVVVRALQPALQQALGQALVIDNRSGAGGTLGSGLVAKAAPDGYTVGVATTSTHAVSVAVYTKLPYNPETDFSYAGFIGTSPYVLVATPALKAVDLKGLVQAVNARADGASYASVGVGTVSHLLGEKFKAAFRFNSPPVHVAYRGAAPAYTDLLSGQVQFLFDNPVGLAPYIRGGQLTAIATTAPNALLVGVPTFAQAGLSGFDQSLWYGFAFPKGTPPAIVERFNRALNSVLTDRALAAELAAKGVNATPGTPAAMQQAVLRDIPFWGSIARQAGATTE